MKTIKLLAVACITAFSGLQASAEEAKGELTVYKTPWCGCCQVWVDAMQSAGYAVKIHDLQDLTQVKRQAGVSGELEACHTAVLDDSGRKYVLEGHVPVQAVEKLMTERPDIRGIAVPGMPSGSLGMGYDEKARYDVYAFTGAASEKPVVFYEAGK